MASCVSLSDESFALRLSSLKAMARGFTQRQVFTTAVDAASHASRWADGANSGTTGRGGSLGWMGSCAAVQRAAPAVWRRVVLMAMLEASYRGSGVDGRGRAASRGDGAAAAWRGVHSTWLLLACDGSARPHRRKQSPHSSQRNGDLAAPPDSDPRPPHARRFHRISTAPRPPWPTGSPPSTSSTLVRCAAAPPMLLRTHC
jgi:hypothetical protein